VNKGYTGLGPVGAACNYPLGAMEAQTPACSATQQPGTMAQWQQQQQQQQQQQHSPPSSKDLRHC